MKWREAPITGEGTTGIEPCFRLSSDLDYSDSWKRMIFRVDLGDTYFVHAILIVQGAEETSNLGNYKFYVGDDISALWLNPICRNGKVFMEPGDASNYD